MDTDLVDAYRRGSDWAIQKIEGARDKLDAPTPCEGWDVRTLLNHMLQTQQYFAGSAQGKEASPPTPEPPSLIGDDPATEFKASQAEIIDAFSKPGAVDKNPMGIGIAFSDMLVHGCDVARATGQDDTMPDGLAEAAYGVISPNINADNRANVFGPEVAVPDDAPAQAKLLGFTGRAPSA